MGRLVLVDLRGVDVDVDDPPVLGELAELARHPVVEPDAEGEQEVGLVDRVVRVDRPVHAEHAEAEIMVRRHRAQPLQGHGDRDARLVDELAQLFRRPRGDHAAAAVEDGSPALLDRLGDRADGLGRGRRRQAIAGEVHRDVVIRVRDGGVLDVLGDVDQHRAGAAGRGDVEGFLDDPRDVLRVLDEVMVLGDRPADLDHRRFLERVGADDLGGDLPGDGDDRQRVELGVGQAGDEVQGAGAGGRHHDAGPAGDAGVALGREDAALLVAGEDRPDPVPLAGERLVHRHAGAARVGEDDVDAVPREGLDQDVGPGGRQALGRGRRAVVGGGHGRSLSLQSGSDVVPVLGPGNRLL